MKTPALIDSPRLADHLLTGSAGDIAVLDCSFELADPTAGRRAFAASSIPGSAYVHLDETLSGPKNGRNGRHPLPDRETFAKAMASLGIGDTTWVIACDRNGGMYAARLWWLLRWLGHERVSVLDGGVQAWLQAAPAVTSPARNRGDARFTVRRPLVDTVDLAAVRRNLATAEFQIIDARGADRFRGENETMDPVGGHIPGARNRPFALNLQADGRFKSPEQLRDGFATVLAGRAPTQVVLQCGSGVTACHNLLAMASAGLDGARLYPGSWSEWCVQPDAPIATGLD